MTPKEKAELLVLIFQREMPANYIHGGKNCAIKCVDQIIINTPIGQSAKDNHGNSVPLMLYWRMVKDEIQLYKLPAAQ